MADEVYGKLATDGAAFIDDDGLMLMTIEDDEDCCCHCPKDCPVVPQTLCPCSPKQWTVVISDLVIDDCYGLMKVTGTLDGTYCVTNAGAGHVATASLPVTLTAVKYNGLGCNAGDEDGSVTTFSLKFYIDNSLGSNPLTIYVGWSVSPEYFQIFSGTGTIDGDCIYPTSGATNSLGYGGTATFSRCCGT